MYKNFPNKYNIPDSKPTRLECLRAFCKNHIELIEAVGFVIGFFVLVTYIAQGFFMYIANQSTQDALKIAQKNADTAEQSINVSKQALALAQDTAQKQLRAYLVINEPVVDAFDKTNPSTFYFRIKIKNSGLTPAHNITAKGSWYKNRLLNGLPVKIEDDFAYPLMLAPNPKNRPMFPDGTYYLGPSQDVDFTVIVDKEDINIVDPVYFNQYATFVYGTITYTDIYNATHCKNFSFLIAFDPSRNVMSEIPTPVHNDEL